jgi:hypothetical protein
VSVVAIAAFATVDDLQAGWKTLTEAEQGVASTLLLRATAQLSAMLANGGIEIDPEDELQALNLQTVTCNMVRRSMSSAAVDGLSSVQQSIGSTSASVQVYNPDGAFFLSKMDKEILGLSDSGDGIGWARTVYVDDGEDGE